MAVDIAIYPSALIPTNDTDPVGGNINTAGGELSEGTENVLVPALVIPAEGEADGGPYYYANCVKNEGDTSFTSPRFWLENGLLKPSAQGTITVQTETASESGKVRLIFLSSGEWITDDVTVSGLGLFESQEQADSNSPVLAIRISSGGAQTNATGNILISRGSSLGYIPQGRSTASSIVQLGIDLVVDSTAQSSNRLTAPSGVSFSEAYTYATGIYIPGPVDLDAGEFIKLWYKVTVPDGLLPPVDYYQPVLAGRGTS